MSAGLGAMNAIGGVLLALVLVLPTVVPASAASITGVHCG